MAARQSILLRTDQSTRVGTSLGATGGLPASVARADKLPVAPKLVSSAILVPLCALLSLTSARLRAEGAAQRVSRQIAAVLGVAGRG